MVPCLRWLPHLSRRGGGGGGLGGGGGGNDYIFYFAQIATRIKVLNVSVADGFRCTIVLILYLRI